MLPCMASPVPYAMVSSKSKSIGLIHMCTQACPHFVSGEFLLFLRNSA